MKFCAISLCLSVFVVVPAFSQGPRQAAPEDLTGYWVSVVTEDYRWRMVTPLKGDAASVPINAAARRIVDAWDPAKDEAAGLQCKAYGAAALMRIPGRLHITWQDDNTLKIETDAGQQTRLLHFGGARPPAGDRTLQGYSTATWVAGGGGPAGGFGGFGGSVAAPDAAARGQGAGAPVAGDARGAPGAGGRDGQAPAAAAAPAGGRGGALGAGGRGGGR